MSKTDEHTKATITLINNKNFDIHANANTQEDLYMSNRNN